MVFSIYSKSKHFYGHIAHEVFYGMLYGTLLCYDGVTVTAFWAM